MPAVKRVTNPLTFVMPLKKGTTYDGVLALQQTLVAGQAAVKAALAGAGTVHFARFVLFDASSPTLQPQKGSKGPFSVAVITEYDGSFETYATYFAQHLGPIFEDLLKLSDDGAQLVPIADHIEEFIDYTLAHDASQQGVNKAQELFLYSYNDTVKRIVNALQKTYPK